MLLAPIGLAFVCSLNKSYSNHFVAHNKANDEQH